MYETHTVLVFLSVWVFPQYVNMRIFIYCDHCTSMDKECTLNLHVYIEYARIGMLLWQYM